MTSVAGLQLDSLASSERITELFPKCRPRDSLGLGLAPLSSCPPVRLPVSELMDSKKSQDR